MNVPQHFALAVHSAAHISASPCQCHLTASPTHSLATQPSNARRLGKSITTPSPEPPAHDAGDSHRSLAPPSHSNHGGSGSRSLSSSLTLPMPSPRLPPPQETASLRSHASASSLIHLPATQSPITTERSHTRVACYLLRYKTTPPFQCFVLVLSHTISMSRHPVIHRMWFA
jgi:hypothetical protein